MKAKKSERVAIIGSGPAGLSAAWDLAIEGYKVTIFEALPVAGGMLAVAIPEYRLPKKVLRKEIQEIQDLGVEIKLNSPVTDAADLLNQGYKAVFIASGAHAEVKLGVQGEDLNGVFDAIKFLRAVHLDKPIKVGKKVAVIGGGNSAIDSARVALRKGAKEVHLFYRREKADIPADKEEIIAAEEEGIQFHYLTAPVKVLGNGKVDGLELTKMALGEFDLTGRKIASAIPGSEYKVAVDTIISAIGQRPDPSFVKEGTIKIAKNKTIVADKRTLATGMKGVFAGGDAVTGPWTVINAIAAGQRAASSIRRYLEGSDISARLERSGFEPISISQTPTSEEELKEKARAVNQEIGLKDRKTSFREVIIPFSEKEARVEAGRCMRCDLDLEA
ncbi:MAG: FAD-dependent oxidoreductase [Chloroflexi bacterium]|nr:FAD-dependent oxidoreductase [Chloroflexota bacterium]